MNRSSIIPGNPGNTCDRFLSSGCKGQPAKADMVRPAAGIHGGKAVEFVQGIEAMLDDATMDELRGIVARGEPIEYARWRRSKPFRK